MQGVPSGTVVGARRLLVWLLGLVLLAGCTDLQVSSHFADPRGFVPTGGAFRFAREAPGQVASAPARISDAAAREAISASLAGHGYHPAARGEAASLVVDFTLSDGIAANAARLDGPSDYRRSWRAGGAGDGTGSMDHTVADSAFRRELALTVLLRPAAAATVAWEGRVSRSVAPDYPDAELAPLLARMCKRLFAELR
jgi:hypothetical protein